MIITSPHNERVKLVRALQTRGKIRREEGRIALEGVRLVSDVLGLGVQPDFVLYTADLSQGAGVSLLDQLQKQGVPCLEVMPDIMAQAADTQSPQGVIAVVPMPDLKAPDRRTMALILDGVADPGNLGSILRTAAAASADVVLLAPGCVDPYNPKALRGGMGAHFRIPLMRLSWLEIAKVCQGLTVYLAEADGQVEYTAVDWTLPSGVIIGGEARGANAQATTLIGDSGKIISIPMGNEAESLNAAIAAGVILFEIRRQRRLQA